MGLTVSKAEVQAIIEEGTNPLLMQTPFRNPQTGAFDKDMLKKFLVDYAHLDASKMPAQYVEYYQKMGAFWNFIVKKIYYSVTFNFTNSILVAVTLIILKWNLSKVISSCILGKLWYWCRMSPPIVW